MTNTQINETLAAWLSKRTGTAYNVCPDTNAFQITGVQSICYMLALFTNSLDSVRMVEDAMTNEERGNYCLELFTACNQSYFDSILAPPDVRARCAVKALGLEEET